MKRYINSAVKNWDEEDYLTQVRIARDTKHTDLRDQIQDALADDGNDTEIVFFFKYTDATGEGDWSYPCYAVRTLVKTVLNTVGYESKHSGDIEDYENCWGQDGSVEYLLRFSTLTDRIILDPDALDYIRETIKLGMAELGWPLTDAEWSGDGEVMFRED